MLYRYEKHIGLGPYTHSSHMALIQLMENHSTLSSSPEPPNCRHSLTPRNTTKRLFIMYHPLCFVRAGLSFLGFSRGIFPQGFLPLVFPWRMLGSTLLNRLTPLSPAHFIHAHAQNQSTLAHASPVARDVPQERFCFSPKTDPLLASFPGLLPPSPLRMLASDNYAWVYLRRPSWYILSRDACRDCHRARCCDVENMIDDRSQIKWLPPEVNVILRRSRHASRDKMYHAFSENTPTRNYNLRRMRAWRREKAWFRGYTLCLHATLYLMSARAVNRSLSLTTHL